MRAMLVSFASYNLWLHWPQPAAHLARLFLDYEPGIHYPQVQMQSGVTGINTLRIYNQIKQKQAQEHDPRGASVRHWLPALRRGPDWCIFEPWLMPPAIQQEAGCLLGGDYPWPVVDWTASMREAKQKKVNGGRARRICARHQKPSTKSTAAAALCTMCRIWAKKIKKRLRWISSICFS